MGSVKTADAKGEAPESLPSVEESKKGAALRVACRWAKKTKAMESNEAPSGAPPKRIA